MSFGGRSGQKGPQGPAGRWLDPAVTGAEKELRRALDEAANRDADEVALRRVWSRLAQAPDLITGDLTTAADGARTQGRSWWKWALSAWLVGAGTVAAATIILMTLRARDRQGHGDAGTASIGPSRRELSAQEVSAEPERGDQSVLVAPATVRTAAGEVLNLSLRGGTAVTLNAESILTLDRDDRPTVAAGNVRFHVPHQAAGHQFVVGARNYRIVVVGTRFAVQVGDPTAASRARTNGHMSDEVNHEVNVQGNAQVKVEVEVEVEEGVVQVWDALGKAPLAVLHAGEAWSAPSAMETTPAARASTETERPALAAARVAAGPRLRAAVGTTSKGPVHPIDSRGRGHQLEPLARGQATPGHAAERLVALGSPTDRGADGVAATGSAGDGRFGNDDEGLAALLGPGPAALDPTSHQASPSPPAATALAPARSPASAVASRAPTPEIAALLGQAKAARAAGERHKALGLYRRLVENGGPVGEDAAYEMGRLYRDELSQPREAIATWRLYRARNPRGLLRIEADLSIIETLMALDDKSGALSEASDFIRRYPAGERHPEMARLVGDLSRERGECQAAIDAYDEVLGDGRAGGAIVDEVSFHRAVCLLRKNPNAGRDAIRAYSQKFPNGRYRAQAERLLGGAPLDPGGPSAH